MWVTLHALTLILLPLVTLYAITRSPARPKLGAVAGATLVGLLMFVLSATFTTCCLEPLQWRQFLIPTVCAILAIIFIRNSILSATSTLTCLALALGLGAHIHRLRGPNQWTGMPNLAALSASSANGWLKELGGRLRVSKDNVSYPPCWLREHTNRDVAVEGMVMPPKDSWSEPVWHSWLTGLYRRHDIERDFWYPGGTPLEAANALELRRRPDLIDRLQENASGHHVEEDGPRRYATDVYSDNRDIIDDAITFADFLGEYALRNNGRLPESLAQLATGTIRREPDGRLIEARTSKQVVNPDQFSWPLGARVEPLPAPHSQPATRSSDPAARHLMQVTGRNISESLLNQLDTRIRWIRFNGHVSSVE